MWDITALDVAYMSSLCHDLTWGVYFNFMINEEPKEARKTACIAADFMSFQLK